MRGDRITVGEAKERAMQQCSRREYCRREMFGKVVAWGCTPADAQNVIDSLVGQGFIDDRRYAGAYVRDKLRFNKWGRVKIEHMLRVQGVDDALIQEALSGIDEHEYLRILADELAKKYKTFRRDNAFEAAEKLFRFAAGRGFETDVIHTVIAGMHVR